MKIRCLLGFSVSGQPGHTLNSVQWCSLTLKLEGLLLLWLVTVHVIAGFFSLLIQVSVFPSINWIKYADLPKYYEESTR